MEKFSFVPQYLTRNGSPWFPIMGEMHYSRTDRRFWDESIRKMKAGGVDIVSSYVIWNHHEEIEDEYDFSGNRDLRTFVETIQRNGLYFFIRIGPWSHGEVRRGGFPDWLFSKGFELRTNDPAYFQAVEKYYRKIYQQVEGLLLKDGGPIIGVQIENEYGHCGGLTGAAGEAHMRRLTALAKEVGFDLPYMTATGWGGAVTAGLLPVMGGYPDAPWDQRSGELEPSGNFIFTHERNDHNIGSDHHVGFGLNFDPADFPYLTAELGGGLQVTYQRRPVATARDIGAMSLAKLGSGVSLLGYYMYHGGTNPTGKRTSLQESRAAGDICDVPVHSYDFRAPIREFGQISDSYRELKLLTLFLKDFGEELCRMPAALPESNPLNPQNLTDLRTAVRSDGKRGYLFVNNYQRRQVMADHERTVLTVSADGEELHFPSMDIRNGDFFFLPFNLPVGNGTIRTANATPLCRLNDDATVFYTDQKPVFEFSAPLEGHKLIVLMRDQAKNALKCTIDQRQYLILTDGLALMDHDAITLHSWGVPSFSVTPDLPAVPVGFEKVSSSNEFQTYRSLTPEKYVNPRQISFQQTHADAEKIRYEIVLDYPEGISDCLLEITYVGNTAVAATDTAVITDDFYAGPPWQIGLKAAGFPKRIWIEIQPLHRDEPIYLEKWPEFQEETVGEIKSIRQCFEYQTRLSSK